MDQHLPKFGEDAYRIEPYLCFEMIYRIRDQHIQDHSKTYAYFSLRDALRQMLSTDLKAFDSYASRAQQIDHVVDIRILDLAGDITYANMMVTLQEDKVTLILETDLDLRQLQDMTGIPFGARDMLDEVFQYKMAIFSTEEIAFVPTPEFAQMQNWLAEENERRSSITASEPYTLMVAGVQVDENTSRTPQQDYVHFHYYRNLYEPTIALLKEEPAAYDVYGPYKDNEVTRRYALILDAERNQVANIKIIKIDEAVDEYPTAGMYLMADGDISDLEVAAGINLSKLKYYDGEAPGLLLAPYRYDFGFQLNSQIYTDDLLPVIERGQLATSVPPQSPYAVELYYRYHPSSDYAQQFKEVMETYHYPDMGQALRRMLYTDFHTLEDSVLCHGLPYKLEHAHLLYEGQLVGSLMQVPIDELRPAQLVLALEPWLHSLIPNTINRVFDLSVEWQHLQRVRGKISIPIAAMPERGVFQPLEPIIDRLVTIFTDCRKGLPEKVPGADMPQGIDTAAEQRQPALHIDHKIVPPPAFAVDLVWRLAGQSSDITVPLPAMDLGRAHHLMLSIHAGSLRPDNGGYGAIVSAVNIVRLEPGKRRTIASRQWMDAAGERSAGIYITYNGTEPACLALTTEAVTLGATGTEEPGLYKDLPISNPRIEAANDRQQRTQMPPGFSNRPGR